MGDHGCGDEQEQRDGELGQREAAAAGAGMDEAGDDDGAHAQCRGLGGGVQAHVELRQPGQADGTDEREGRTDEQQGGDDKLGHSMMSPPSTNLASATVPTKPIMARSSAASK